MTLQEYQNQTATTAVYPKDQGITYCALALASEAGEVADAIARWIRNHSITNVNDLKYVRHREDVHKALGMIAQEIGGVLWNCSQLASELELDLELIARANLLELQERQKNKNIKKEKSHIEEDLKLSTQQITRFCTICNKPIFDHATVVTVQKSSTIDKQFHIACWVTNNAPQI